MARKFFIYSFYLFVNRIIQMEGLRMHITQHTYTHAHISSSSLFVHSFRRMTYSPVLQNRTEKQNAHSTMDAPKKRRKPPLNYWKIPRRPWPRKMKIDRIVSNQKRPARVYVCVLMVWVGYRLGVVCDSDSLPFYSKRSHSQTVPIASRGGCWTGS